LSIESGRQSDLEQGEGITVYPAALKNKPKERNDRARIPTRDRRYQEKDDHTLEDSRMLFPWRIFTLAASKRMDESIDVCYRGLAVLGYFNRERPDALIE